MDPNLGEPTMSHFLTNPLLPWPELILGSSDWSWTCKGRAEESRGEQECTSEARGQLKIGRADITCSPGRGEKGRHSGAKFSVFFYRHFFFFNKSLPGGSESGQREICRDDGLPEIKYILSAVCPSACPSVNNL